MIPRSQQIRSAELASMARHLRKLRGLTLEASAAELGVSASGLSQAERGTERMVQLALRSVNEHLKRAAVAGLIGHGHVREQFRAFGSANDVLGEVRGPEIARRGGLLRQALLARSITLMTDGHSAYVDVVGARVEVDLRTMFVFAVKQDDKPRGPFSHMGIPLGRIIDTEAESPDPDEAWAHAIDRFASALVAATMKAGPFNPRPIQNAIGVADPEGPPSTNPDEAIET